MVSCDVQAQTLSRADGSTGSRSWVEVNYGPVVKSLNGEIVLTHSVSEIPVDSNSATCNEDGTGYHTDNSYYRRFDLPEFNVDGDLTIDSVRIAIEGADSGGDGGQSFDLRFHTLTGEFVTANLDPLGNETVFVEDTTLSLLSVPVNDVVVPADSELVVEVFVPDGREAGYRFYIGSNAEGETDSTYFAAEACDIDEPTSMAEVGFPDMHLIMTVFGRTGVVGTEPGADEPRQVVLGQSYPNPLVGDVATIPFEVSTSSEVRIAVYDALGRRVAVVANRPYAVGSHAVTFDTSGLPGGTYTYRIMANGEVQARRMVIVR